MSHTDEKIELYFKNGVSKKNLAIISSGIRHETESWGINLWPTIDGVTFCINTTQPKSQWEARVLRDLFLIGMHAHHETEDVLSSRLLFVEGTVRTVRELAPFSPSRVCAAALLASPPPPPFFPSAFALPPSCVLNLQRLLL